MDNINDGGLAFPAPKYDNPTYSWTPISTKTFSVEVKCWKFEADADEWRWNVYANIFNNHPLFSNPTAAIDSLAFHGGCTYDKIKTIEPAQGIRYDFERVYKTLVVGCDYSHYRDSYYELCDPKDGVPGSIMSDVAELIQQLSERDSIAKAGDLTCGQSQTASTSSSVFTNPRAKPATQLITGWTGLAAWVRTQ